MTTNEQLADEIADKIVGLGNWYSGISDDAKKIILDALKEREGQNGSSVTFNGWLSDKIDDAPPAPPTTEGK